MAGGEAELRAKPFLLLYAEPISPLLFNQESVGNLMFCAEKGIPGAYLPSPNTGGGGPITMAGALALGNAESLVGLLLTQLVRPGAPFLYGMNVAALDMQSTIVAYGAPDWAQAMAAFSDMARFYHLPVWGGAGATDSKVVDAQAGFEATTTIMSAFMSRCNVVHDVGYMEYGSTSSMELLVICDEIIRHTRFIVDGVEVSERTLAREAIGRARPGGGFFADDHTLENWKAAQWRPRVVDRQRYGNWQKRGSKDMAARANDWARRAFPAGGCAATASRREGPWVGAGGAQRSHPCAIAWAAGTHSANAVARSSWSRTPPLERTAAAMALPTGPSKSRAPRAASSSSALASPGRATMSPGSGGIPPGK